MPGYAPRFYLLTRGLRPGFLAVYRGLIAYRIFSTPAAVGRHESFVENRAWPVGDDRTPHPKRSITSVRDAVVVGSV